MGRLILVRHGESSGNRLRLFACDPHGLPLTELGYAQARAAAATIGRLFQPSLVVTSPYVRAHETARIIAGGLGAPFETEAGLYERDVGVFHGQPYDSIRQAPDYDALHPWAWRPAGGESYEEVQSRVGPILDRLARTHADTDVVVVSHGGVMKALWAYTARDWQAAPIAPNCGIVLVEHDAQGYAAPRMIAWPIPQLVP